MTAVVDDNSTRERAADARLVAWRVREVVRTFLRLVLHYMPP